MDRHALAGAAGHPPRDVAAMHPLTLAYVGDTVYELAVRVALVDAHDAKPGALSRYASGKVRASAQARVARELFPRLDESERAVYLRGRNARPGTLPKHADAADYMAATGLEAVLGMLFLSGETGRLTRLMEDIFLELTEIEDKLPKKPFRG